MQSYVLRPCCTKAMRRKNTSSVVCLPCCASMYSINLFTVWKCFIASLHTDTKTNILNIHIKDTNQLLIALRLPECIPSSFLCSPFPSLSLYVFLHMCDMSKSYFNVLAPLILKANIRWCVLMIVSNGHLSSVKLHFSKEVNTPSELWLF